MAGHLKVRLDMFHHIPYLSHVRSTPGVIDFGNKVLGLVARTKLSLGGPSS